MGALNRVAYIINSDFKLVSGKIDFIRNHINIASESLKIFFEKRADKIPRRMSIDIYRTDHALRTLFHYKKSKCAQKPRQKK